jgi:hypothetical protein
MAQIPRIILPSVAPQSQRSPEVAAPTAAPMQNFQPQGTAALGEGMQILGRGVHQMGERIQDERNLAVTKQKVSMLADELRNTYDHPDNGYLRKVGSAALGTAREDADARIAEVRRQLEESLENDDQRRVFADRAEAMIRQNQGRVDNHLATQTRVAAVGASEATLAGAMLDATIQFGTEGYNDRRLEIDAELANLAQLKGSTPEQANLDRRVAYTSLHGRVINELLNKDTPESVAQAKLYFEKYKDEILPGEDTARIQKSIDSASIKKFAELTSEQHDREGRSMAESFDHADQLLKDNKISADAHKALLDSTISRYNRNRLAEQAQSNDTRKTVMSMLDQDRRNAAAEGRAPRGLADLLTPAQLTDVESNPELYDQLSAYAVSGRFRTTVEGQRFLDRVTAPGNQELKLMSSEDIESFVTQLSPPAHQLLREAWAKAQNIPLEKAPTFDAGQTKYLKNLMFGPMKLGLDDEEAALELELREIAFERFREELMTSGQGGYKEAIELAKSWGTVIGEEADGGRAITRARIIGESMVYKPGEEFNLDEFQTPPVDVQLADGAPSVPVRVKFEELKDIAVLNEAKAAAAAKAEALKSVGTVSALEEAAVLETAITTGDRPVLAGVLASARAVALEAKSKSEQAAAISRSFAAGQRAAWTASPERAAYEAAVGEKVGPPATILDADAWANPQTLTQWAKQNYDPRRGMVLEANRLTNMAPVTGLPPHLALQRKMLYSQIISAALYEEYTRQSTHPGTMK